MQVAPAADPPTACSRWCLSSTRSKLRFLANLPKVFKGKHVEVDGVQVHRAREVEIAADRPFDVYADGEILTSLPATVRLVPGALRVIAPPPDARRLLGSGSRSRSRRPSGGSRG